MGNWVRGAHQAATTVTLCSAVMAAAATAHAETRVLPIPREAIAVRHFSQGNCHVGARDVVRPFVGVHNAHSVTLFRPRASAPGSYSTLTVTSLNLFGLLGEQAKAAVFDTPIPHGGRVEFRHALHANGLNWATRAGCFEKVAPGVTELSWQDAGESPEHQKRAHYLITEAMGNAGAAVGRPDLPLDHRPGQSHPSSMSPFLLVVGKRAAGLSAHKELYLAIAGDYLRAETPSGTPLEIENPWPLIDLLPPHDRISTLGDALAMDQMLNTLVTNYLH